MTKTAKILLPVCLFAVMVMPSLMLAQESYSIVDNNNACAESGDCKFQDLLNLFGKVFEFFVIIIAVPLTTLAIAYGGFLYLVSSTNEGKRSEAKSIITNAVIGLAIALAAYVIVKSLLIALKVDPTYIPQGFTTND